MIRAVKLPALLSLTVLSLLALGCAGKKGSPVDAEVDAFNTLRANVQEVVTDPVRAEQTLALVDDLQRVFDDVKELRAQRRQRIRAFNANYDATRTDLDSLLDNISQERIANQKRVSSIYREFRAGVTPEEWAGLVQTSGKTMKAAIAAIQSI